MTTQRASLPHAQGCLLGALIGDAVGATLEFLGREPRAGEIDHALTLPGGGVLSVAPGQVTDDGELTLALARALVDSDVYPVERVASNYLRWLSSSPFDVGNATQMAMDCRTHAPRAVHREMASNAQTYNLASKANGALMRCSPLGIWAARLDEKETVQAAIADTKLSHPNPTCLWASAAYVSALRHLMLYPGDASGAHEAACASLGIHVPEASEAQAGDGQAEVRAWLEDAAAGRLPACHPMAGFVRIGFTHAFFHLLQESSFETALRQTLSGGGDTDTNACIVGALLGALHGIDAIPAALTHGVVRCDTRLGHERPQWLRATYALDLVAQLCG